MVNKKSGKKSRTNNNRSSKKKVVAKHEPSVEAGAPNGDGEKDDKREKRFRYWHPRLSLTFEFLIAATAIAGVYLLVYQGCAETERYEIENRSWVVVRSCDRIGNWSDIPVRIKLLIWNTGNVRAVDVETKTSIVLNGKRREILPDDRLLKTLMPDVGMPVWITLGIGEETNRFGPAIDDGSAEFILHGTITYRDRFEEHRERTEFCFKWDHHLNDFMICKESEKRKYITNE